MCRLNSFPLLVVIFLFLSSCEKEISLPIIKPMETPSVTSSGASGYVVISSNGGSEVTERGICWSLTTTPTTNNNVARFGTGIGNYSWSISSLIPGTHYFIRAFATNKIGTIYGNEISFTTESVLASITTKEITSITATSAKSGGNITDDGGSTVTIRGVCWDILQNPTISSNKTSDGSGLGEFLSTISSLSAGTQYYVRAYVTNGIGTAYGNELSFTTPKIAATITTADITSITATSAVSGGTIADNGSGTITSKGVCWGIGQNPTISDSRTSDVEILNPNPFIIKDTVAAVNSILLNAPGGSFVSNITGLTPGITYYVRAYATNDVSTSYGEQKSFSTPIQPATITTTAATSLTSNSAISGGNITSDGGSPVTGRGVCWSTTQYPTIADNHTSDGSGVGIFSSSITGLSPGTTYYIRAYGTNGTGTSYGNQVIFTTITTFPIINTTAIIDITPETAISGGNITSDGGSPVTARGVCWSTSQNPTITDMKSTDGSGTGTFTSNVTGLLSSTTYYLRAYATNSVGTGYGNTESFTTIQPSTDSDYKPTGMLFSSNSDIESLPSIETLNLLQPVQVKSSGTLPSSFEIEVPTPINQNYYNNCVANAVGFGMMSVLFKNVEGHNDFNGDDRKFSPFYIWNQLNLGGINKGIKIVSALKLVIKQGCCKLSDMPLTTLPSTNPSYLAQTNAANYKLSVYKFDGFNINTFKYYLVNGYPLVIGIQIDNAFMSKSYKQFEIASKGRYVWKKYFDSSYSAHSMLICGYDDEIHAFKVMNSWGDNWANNGFFWIDYDFFETTLNIDDPLKIFKDEVYIGIVERPIIFTNSIVDITNTTAISGGKITNDFGHNITEKGICWSINSDPSIFDNKINNGTGKENFDCTITGLSSNTKYYVKAYAINNQGIAYGTPESFTTTSTLSPTVTTSQITIFNTTSATVGGNVTADGGSKVTERGIYWSTNPLTLGTKLQIGSGTGVFSSNLTGLSPNTTYYIKAFATNSQGTGYGTQVSFTTGLLPVAAFIGTPTTINTGQSVQFTDQSTNSPTSWNWNFGDGGTSIIQNPSHTYSTKGTYNVSLTATNGFGSNTLTKTSYITVNIASPTVTDIDGNVYHIVPIGTQEWLVENLKTTKYQDGTTIPNITADGLSWSGLKTGAYCNYNNLESNVEVYGRLYNYYAIIDERKLCMKGWHIPDEDEISDLISFLEGESSAGGMLKEIGTTHWLTPNIGATNSSGFTALPGGGRIGSGTFTNIGLKGYYWNSLEKYAFSNLFTLSFDSNSSIKTYGYKYSDGYSVRCVKDKN